MFCELYESIIDGVPVTCQIIDICSDTGMYCVQYFDENGAQLQKWVRGDTIWRTPKEEISQ